ncbi:MAG: outer membrane lipoprotein carrier protein LolA, partial [Gemmatimonadota bacterium]|jgi:outer membrane lipoprotein carrier protein
MVRDSTPAPSAAAGTATPQDSALALLRRTAARYASIRSMRATFSMETRNPLLRETVKSRGELFQRRPDRLLMRFTEPAGDVIVSDGQYIWVWYPSVDSTQVIRSAAGSVGGTVDLLAQFVGDPTKRFSWSVGPTETIDGHAAAMYTLDPLGAEAYRQLVVWIDRDDALVRRFEVIEANGVERRVELLDVVLDADLPDSLFRFTPPPGVRVVGAP